ncbi:Bug family tripartite tricarboxylate transporter substrate binding protein [Pollutimonas bauzanensis]|uniref:Tripartite-type tricarboxylate transporter, receptor component TctC n=1 Tax=Pollutimonas bauzanensis TaxID=658167 RepID=A0A1M5PUU1_9BURK|nr:tripartite tricarboxylate transporter substrate binding protein [Pollutimonas bauzanensis]SHH05588.1 Tripartite-type tricarboxylate transporter, receptor component TctC [Pollutimonas bauzanensis]
MTRLHLMVLAVGASMALMMTGARAADSFPSRSITLVVPSQPGGSIDFLARLLSEPLSKSLGVPVVIDNKAGASGNIGNALVARARPDGYTLLFAYNGFLVANPHLFKTAATDPVNDLTPISMVSRAPQVLVASKQVPANTVQELISYARQHPGELNYASSGNGSVPHLAGELFKKLAGVDIVHIPYKGAGGAVVDLISNQVNIYLTSPAGVMGQIKAGQIKALAVTGKNRLATIPDVPTAQEAGLENFELDSWFALYAPANTPEALRERLSVEVGKVLQDPEIQKRALAAGMALEHSSPQELGAYTKTQLVYWGEVIRDAGLTAQ